MNINKGIYIINDGQDTNKCKVGFHTGTLNLLRKRYITSLPNINLVFYLKVDNNNLEKDIKNEFEKFRILNDNDRLSEWYNIDSLQIINFIILKKIDKPVLTAQIEMKEVNTQTKIEKVNTYTQTENSELMLTDTFQIFVNTIIIKQEHDRIQTEISMDILFSNYKKFCESNNMRNMFKSKKSFVNQIKNTNLTKFEKTNKWYLKGYYISLNPKDIDTAELDSFKIFVSTKIIKQCNVLTLNKISMNDVFQKYKEFCESNNMRSMFQFQMAFTSEIKKTNLIGYTKRRMYYLNGYDILV